jgi:hypothetical protein
MMSFNMWTPLATAVQLNCQKEGWMAGRLDG